MPLIVRRRNKTQGKEFVRASDLAEMAVCERRVLLAARLGERKSASQKRAAHRGIRAHTQFLRDAMSVNPRTETSERAAKCFIATAVYGEAPETCALRRFRDAVLKRTAAGRWAIATYYRLAPMVSRFLERSACGRAVVRILLKPACSMRTSSLLLPTWPSACSRNTTQNGSSGLACFGRSGATSWRPC